MNRLEVFELIRGRNAVIPTCSYSGANERTSLTLTPYRHWFYMDSILISRTFAKTIYQKLKISKHQNFLKWKKKVKENIIWPPYFKIQKSQVSSEKSFCWLSFLFKFSFLSIFQTNIKKNKALIPSSMTPWVYNEKNFFVEGIFVFFFQTFSFGIHSRILYQNFIHWLCHFFLFLLFYSFGYKWPILVNVDFSANYGKIYYWQLII